MKLFNNLEKQHYFLLAGWVLINVVQAFFTNLHPDEAYYWMYSKHLDWGYFDHPPMAAFLIHWGDLIMHNELGVRLFIVLLSGLTIGMIMNELNEKKDLFFLSLFILSFPLVHTHIGGFLALPDTPLVFFTLLFFLNYKRFVHSPNLKLALFLAAIAAAMIYSKYHAFLVLGLIVLSNLKLLTNKYFWIIITGTLVLLIPHLLWQFENNWPTFTYHLIGHKEPVKLENITNNILSQLAVAGPLSGVIVLYSLLKVKTKQNLFNRAILFNILGFYLLLTLMSLNNWIEAHWTVAVTPLLILVTYPIISANPITKKWFKRLSLPIVVLFFMFRFYLAADFIPNVGYTKFFFYKQKEKSMEIKNLAGDLKVASLYGFNFSGTYEFYTGDTATHLATAVDRFCQYDLWNIEERIIGDSLFIVISDRIDTTNLITLCNGQRISIGHTSQFQSLKLLTIDNNSMEKTSELLTIDVTLTNKSARAIVFDHPSQPAIGYAQSKKVISTTSIFQITGKNQILPGEKISFNYNIPLEKIDPSQSFIIFTQTIERNRGNLISVTIPK